MLLEHLSLRNFRLFGQASVSLAPGVNVICGDNAQGKTSILESLMLLILGRGIRGAGISLLIKWEEVQGQVEAVVMEKERRSIIRSLLSKGKRIKYTIDGSNTGMGELYRFFPVVPFWPADAELVRGDPETRRGFMDGMLARLSGSYLKDLRRYRRALLQRNALLRSRQLKGLELWEQEMAAYGGLVAARRLKTISWLDPVAGRIYFDLTEGKEKLSLRYLCSWIEGDQTGELSEHLMEALKRSRLTDLKAGHTQVGPHRDDLGVFIEGRDMRLWASQGQQKEGSLALRMAQAELVAEALGKEPLLLMDDVFTELDESRRRRLGEFLNLREQVIITTSEVGLLPGTLKKASILVAKDGKVIQQ